MRTTIHCLAIASIGLAAALFSAQASAQPAENPAVYNRLADTETAVAIGLSDEQKASVARIMTERDAAITAAETEEGKSAAAADAQAKLAGLLTPEQQTKFSELFSSPRIKFNFRFQKWSEVLPWVALEAGLSLSMEEAPEGTFNYSDRREYKPEEAIDLLNGWLMIKGFTLIHRDQQLMCISLKDGIPAGTVARVPLDELPNRGRFEFVSVLIPLEARVPETVMTEIEPLLSQWGEAKPLTATGQLLVTDAADIVRNIQKVAMLVPPPKAAPKPPAPKEAPKPELKVYPLKHANPEKAGEVIKSLIAGSLVVDVEAGQVSINAIPAEQAKVQTIIEQLEANHGADKQPQMKSYPVHTDYPQEMLESLKLTVPSATMRYDATTKRIVAFATPADHETLTAAMLELENEATASEDQLSVHTLKDIDPAVAQQLITSVLPDVRDTVDTRTSTLIAVGRLSELRAVQTLIEQLQPEAASIEEPVLQSYIVRPEISAMASTVISSVAPTATVTPDSTNDRLLIVALPKDHVTIATTLEKLGKDVVEDGLVLKSYDATGITYSSVAPLLQMLAPQAQLIDETSKQRLLAVASAEDHEEINNVLEQVREDPEAQRPTLKTFPLPENVAASTVSSLLSSLVPQATVTIDDANKRILVTASEDDLATVEPMLAQLSAGLEMSHRQLKSYPLKADVDPATVTTLLNSLTPSASVTADAVGHRLLITATSNEHSTIDAAIRQITQDARGELPQLQYYPLENVDGNYATGILSAIVPGATVQYEQEAKRLSVIASPTDHALLQPTLEKLKTATPEQEKRAIKVYSVTNSLRNRFNTVLQGLSEEIPGLQVLADGEPGEMIVWAKPSQHEIVDTILAQLDRDVPPEQKPSLVVYPITKVEAESVAEVLQEIFPDASIKVDRRSSRLLVRARPAMQETIKAAIKQLDAELPEGQEIKLMVYPVSGINADSALSLIMEEVPKVTVIRDDTAKTFIVRGRLEEHQEVAKLLDTLRSSPLGKRIPVVYPSFHNDPREEREFFQRAFPGAEVIVDADSRTLTVVATAEDQELIKKTIDQLSKSETEGSRASTFRIHKVQASAAGNLQSMLAQSVPRARVVVDQDRLLTWAQTEDQAVIAKIVAGLQDASATRKVTAFDISKLDVVTAQNVLSTVAPQTNFLVGQNGQALIATVDEKTKVDVEAALEQLSESPAARQKTTLKFYPVNAATGTSVSNVLSTTLPEVSFTLTSDGTRLFARVTQAQHTKVEEILAQMSTERPFDSNRILKMYSIEKSGPTTSTVLQRMVPSSIVSAGAQANQLMIEATEGEHQRIQELMAQLESAASDTCRELRFYDVDPATLQNTRTALTSVIPEVAFTASTDSTRLIAHVTEEQHGRISAVLEQLAAEEPFKSNRVLKFYGVAKAGGNAASVITRLLPSTVVSPGAQPNQLMVEATPAQHDQIAQVIVQLESAADNDDLKVRFYAVDPPNLSNTQAVINTAVPQVSLTASADSSHLIAVVTEEQHERISVVLEQLATEKPFKSNRVLKFYGVAKAGTSAASVITRLLPSTVVSPGAQPNQLMVEATPAQHDQIAQVIVQLESAADNDGLKVRFYAVDPPNLSNTQSVVNTAVPQVSLTASADSSRLIAVVTDDQHEQIVRVLESLAREKPFDSNRSLQFYSIAGAGADAMTVLQRMIPAALINSGSQAGQVMVEATEAEHLEVVALLESLKTATQDDSRSLKHYELNREQIQNAQELLASAVPGLELKTSADGTRLIALVTDEQDQKIASTLEQLATAAVGAPRKSTSVFDISGTDPDAISRALEPFTAADSNVQITVDSTSRRVYVHAFEDRQEDIREALTQIMSGVTEGADTVVAAYFVGDGNGDEAEEALTALYPDATIVSDRSRRMIIATATPEQHERIKIVAEQMKLAATVGSGAVPRTYETQNLDARYLQTVMRSLFPRDREFTASVNPETGQVVAIGNEEQHKTISEMLKQLDQQPDSSEKTLRVYRTAPLTTATIITALEPMVSKDVTLTAERSGQEIVVSAPPEEQERIAELVQQLRSNRSDADGLQIRSYQMRRGQANTAQSILTSMFPDAKLATDRTYSVLIATALPEQHETINKVVEQLTGRGEGAHQTQARTYLMRQYDGNKMRLLLQQTFTRDDDVRITWDDRNRRIIAVATPEQHEMIASIISDLDPVEGPNVRRLKYYRVTNLDLEGVRESISGGIRHLDPGATIALDYNGQTLLVTTHERGHQMVQEAVSRFKPFVPRQLEVFQLSYLDPGDAMFAIDRMISQQIHRHSSRPQIHPDENQQQLWVRASGSQIEQIRELLIKLGETNLDTTKQPVETAKTNLRVIPIGQDVEGALRRIEELWPRLRTNPIRVVAPGKTPQEQPQSIPGQFSVPPEVIIKQSDAAAVQQEIKNEQQLEEAAEDADPNGILGAAIRVDAESGTIPDDMLGDEAGLENGSPVILIPGDGQITIASDDIEALNQLEELLNTMYAAGKATLENRDFSIRQLRNTSAADVASVIEQILQDTAGITNFGNVAVVPEERLNALIVYGTRSDRRRLEPLLEILDSEKFDNARAYRTALVPIHNASATRIEDILQGIYRAQLRAGGSRSSIDIPSGVPSEVATVLRQINAAASAPLLTIEVQRETNSLIIKAPQDLLKEVSQLAMELDESVKTNRANGLTLVPLKKTSSARVMEILSRVINN